MRRLNIAKMKHALSKIVFHSSFRLSSVYCLLRVSVPLWLISLARYFHSPRSLRKVSRLAFLIISPTAGRSSLGAIGLRLSAMA